jgi:hypothetical protein
MALLDSLASALGTGKQLPKYNSGQLNGIVQNGADTSKGYIGDTMPKLGQATDQLGTNVNSAVDANQKERQDTNNAFLNSIREKRNLATNDQFNTGKQQILGAVPQAQDAIRETLAGSGVGLQGGAAIKALSQPVLEANSKVNDLANSLSQGAQQADINSMGTIQGQDNAALAAKLGIDVDTYNTIMSSDRQDLKDQLNQLLGVTGQSTADQLGIAQNEYNSELASTAADNQSRNALLGSLLGAVGTGVGAYAGRR